MIPNSLPTSLPNALPNALLNALPKSLSNSLHTKLDTKLPTKISIKLDTTLPTDLSTKHPSWLSIKSIYVWFSFRVLANLAGKTHRSAPNLVQIEQIPRYHPHTPKIFPSFIFEATVVSLYAKPVPFFGICRDLIKNFKKCKI